MKTDFVLAVVLFFIGLFAYTKFVGPIPFSVRNFNTEKTDTFNVTGEGKATQAPDIAIISAGVTAQGTAVADVQKQINTKINAISEAVKKLGIDAKDIKTANYNVNPMYDYRVSPQQITGYQANTTFTITVRDITKASAVIDAATGNGATNVNGPTFNISDKSKAENDARTQAVAAARKKAEDAARIAGFTLGRVINYQENFGGNPVPVPLMAKAGGFGAPVTPPTQIEPGQNEVNITVTLSYEIL